MNYIPDLLTVFPGGMHTMLTMLVFFAVATFAFAIMAGVRIRGEVKRRAASINVHSGGHSQASGARSLRQSSLNAAKQLLDYTTKHYSTGDGQNMKVLRRRLLQAGIYDPRGVGFFFVARIGLAVGLALAAFFLGPALFSAT